MPKLEIYTWTFCPFCLRAKALLKKKGVEYTEYDITGDDAGRGKMAERTGGPKTVPQIFVDDEHIGGCDELYELDDKGKLDEILELK